jgi:hypothetical protein
MRLSVLTGNVASEQDAKWFEGDGRRIRLSMDFYMELCLSLGPRERAFTYLISTGDIIIESDRGDFVTLLCTRDHAYHLQMALLMQVSRLNYRW